MTRALPMIACAAALAGCAHQRDHVFTATVTDAGPTAAQMAHFSTREVYVAGAPPRVWLRLGPPAQAYLQRQARDSWATASLSVRDDQGRVVYGCTFRTISDPSSATCPGPVLVLPTAADGSVAERACLQIGYPQGAPPAALLDAPLPRRPR